MVAQAFVETVLTSIGVSAFAMSVNMSIQKKPVHMAAHMSVHMPTHTWSWRSVRIRAGDIFVHCSSSVSSTVMNCASVTVAIPWDARMRLAKFVEPCVPACVRSSVQGPVSFCGCVRPVRPPKKTYVITSSTRTETECSWSPGCFATLPFMAAGGSMLSGPSRRS